MRVVCYCVPVRWGLLQVVHVPGTTEACTAAWFCLSKLWQVRFLDGKALSASSTSRISSSTLAILCASTCFWIKLSNCNRQLLLLTFSRAYASLAVQDNSDVVAHYVTWSVCRAVCRASGAWSALLRREWPQCHQSACFKLTAKFVCARSKANAQVSSSDSIPIGLSLLTNYVNTCQTCIWDFELIKTCWRPCLARIVIRNTSRPGI